MWNSIKQMDAVATLSQPKCMHSRSAPDIENGCRRRRQISAQDVLRTNPLQFPGTAEETPGFLNLAIVIQHLWQRCTVAHGTVLSTGFRETGAAKQKCHESVIQAMHVPGTHATDHKNMPNASREMSTSRFLLLTASAAMSAGPAYATDFNITSPSTAAQTLGTGSGQTGTIQSTGSLTVSGSTVAVTLSGNNATLTNLGTINQTGTGRAVRDNTGVTGSTINNGSTTNSTALMRAADADVIQMNKPASVTLNNYGTMTSLNASKGGAQAVDFNAITSGSNIVNNFATGILQARDADAVPLRDDHREAA